MLAVRDFYLPTLDSNQGSLLLDEINLYGL
jgi:hypothetical protein